MNAFAKIRFFLIIPLICVVVFSCDPNEELPPETILEFVGVQRFADSTGLVAINVQVRFQSGNGNIGLAARDTFPPFVGDSAHNLHVQVFDKISDNVYEPMQTTHLPPRDLVIRYKIPPDPYLLSRNVRGMLDIFIGEPTFQHMQNISTHDVVQLRIYMYNRDLEQSNILITPDISIR